MTKFYILNVRWFFFWLVFDAVLCDVCGTNILPLGMCLSYGYAQFERLNHFTTWIEIDAGAITAMLQMKFHKCFFGMYVCFSCQRPKNCHLLSKKCLIQKWMIRSFYAHFKLMIRLWFFTVEGASHWMKVNRIWIAWFNVSLWILNKTKRKLLLSTWVK